MAIYILDNGQRVKCISNNICQSPINLIMKLCKSAVNYNNIIYLLHILAAILSHMLFNPGKVGWHPGVDAWSVVMGTAFTSADYTLTRHNGNDFVPFTLLFLPPIRKAFISFFPFFVIFLYVIRGPPESP